jgi:hypothetical protein
MLVETATMANPLDTIKKIKGRSFKEIRTRGGQAISARAEQIGLSGKLPSDTELFSLVDGADDITIDDLFDRFYEDAQFNFFPAFRQKEQVLEIFENQFGESAELFIERAEKIVNGKFDLLGYENLNFGKKVNWHYEPLADKHIPFKHWKQFDELSTAETGDKKIVWELNRHQYFFTLGVAYWLTGDERYGECFAGHLDGWMQENPPGIGINWASSLEVSFRVVSWIWAFHFFKDSKHFTPELFQKALKFVYQHGRHLLKYLSTYYSPNTHLTGEALGLYYLGTQFQFFKQASNWRKTGEKILFEELSRQILADGVYFEQSTWYQRYTTDFYTHFLILKTLSGEETDKDLQVELGAKLQSLVDFLMYATRPDGTTPLIGDDDGGRCLPHGNRKSDDFRHVLSTNAVLFERGDYKLVAGEFAEETLWLLGGAGKQSFEFLRSRQPVETSAAFETGGYFIMRDGWTDTDNFLLIDCGELGALSGGHGHADALSINVAVGGVTTLVDSGTYTYHESEALRDYFRSTEAHNTLMIDGESQSEPSGKFSWKTKANAQLKQWISEPRFEYFEGAHDGYERLSATHTRSVLFLKNDYWIIRDFVKSSGKHDYALNFHFDRQTDPQIETAENGVACIKELSPTSGSRIFTFGDNGGWQRKESPISNCYGRRTDSPHLQFSSHGLGAQEFFTFILPNEFGTDSPQVFETEVAGGRAFVINFRGYQDLLVFADGGQTVRTEIFNTNFRFSWARLGAGEALPEEFVMIGGTNFSLGGREIVNYPHELKSATARRLGNKLNVKTSDSIFSLSLPQRPSSTYIVKEDA